MLPIALMLYFRIGKLKENIFDKEVAEQGLKPSACYDSAESLAGANID